MIDYKKHPALCYFIREGDVFDLGDLGLKLIGPGEENSRLRSLCYLRDHLNRLYPANEFPTPDLPHTEYCKCSTEALSNAPANPETKASQHRIDLLNLIRALDADAEFDHEGFDRLRSSFTAAEIAFGEVVTTGSQG